MKALLPSLNRACAHVNCLCDFADALAFSKHFHGGENFARLAAEAELRVIEIRGPRPAALFAFHSPRFLAVDDYVSFKFFAVVAA